MDIFWLKTSGFAKEASFDHKTAFFAMNIKIHGITCLSLS